jgi:hypothetical protein
MKDCGREMVSEHVHKNDVGTEFAYCPADRAHRERIHYLKKCLRCNPLGSVCDIVRRAIAGGSRAARHKADFVSGIPEPRSKPPNVCFRATRATVPIGDYQHAHCSDDAQPYRAGVTGLHDSSPELNASFRTS